MTALFNSLYEEYTSELPTTFEGKQVKIFECTEDLGEDTIAWDAIVKGKRFYTVPCSGASSGSICSNILVLQYVPSSKKFSWRLYKSWYPGFENVLHEGFVKEIKDVNPAEDFLIKFKNKKLDWCWDYYSELHSYEDIVDKVIKKIEIKITQRLKRGIERTGLQDMFDF